MTNYDPDKNLKTLRPEWISLANGRQRQGRAGRLQPGICYRLYSRARESTFAPSMVPEMKRMRLEELVLKVKILKLGRIETFLRHVPDPPDEQTVQASLKLLRSLDALDDDENLTPLGFHLAQLPTDPLTGKLILLAAIFGCVGPVLSIAAALSFKDPFFVPLGKEDLVRQTKKRLAEGSGSDHLVVAKVMEQYRAARRRGKAAAYSYCQQHFLSPATMSMLADMADQFGRDLHERHFLASPSVGHPESNVHSSNATLVGAVLCAGLFPNVARVYDCKRKRKTGGNEEGGRSWQPPQFRIVTAEGERVKLYPSCVVRNDAFDEFRSTWLTYYTKVKTSSIFLFDCSQVSPYAVLFFGGNRLERRNERGVDVVRVGRAVEIRCDPATTRIEEDLRQRWNDYLSRAVSDPQPTDWASADAPLLQAIISFVTTEEVDRSSRTGESPESSIGNDPDVEEDADEANIFDGEEEEPVYVDCGYNEEDAIAESLVSKDDDTDPLDVQ